MTGDTPPEDTPSQSTRGGGVSIAQIGLTFLGVLLVYLFLTAGSGNDYGTPWAREEIFFALVLSALTAFFGAKFLFLEAQDRRMPNPVKFVYFLVYLICILFPAMVMANIQVAIMVIKGPDSLNPGIVRIKSGETQNGFKGLKTNLGTTLLANSITLTPGTLTIDVEGKTNNLFVHWIDVNPGALKPDNSCDIEPVCGRFAHHAGGIAE